MDLILISYPNKFSNTNFDIKDSNKVETYLYGNFETIGEMKQAIFPLSRTSPVVPLDRLHFMTITFEGYITLLIEDDLKPSDYNVDHGSTILITTKMNPTIVEVTVSYDIWSEKCRFSSTDKVSSLKSWIQDEFHIPPRRQILEIYQVEMRAESKLEDYFMNKQHSVRIGEVNMEMARMISVNVGILVGIMDKEKKEGYESTSVLREPEKYIVENRDTLYMLMLNVGVRNVDKNWKTCALFINGMEEKERLTVKDISFEELGVVDGSSVTLVLTY